MNATLAKYWVHITAEPKKAAVLAVLAVVAVFMIGRTAIRSMSGPAPAAASVRTRAAPAANVKGAEAQTRIVFRALAPIRDPDAPPMVRDIFALSAAHFPPTGPDNAPDGRGAKSPAGLDDITDDPRSAQRVEERVRTLAQSLRLRSTLMGAAPMVVIEHGGSGASGTRRSSVLRIGDAVDGFTLVEVTRHWVEVEMDGVRVRLELPAPIK